VGLISTPLTSSLEKSLYTLNSFPHQWAMSPPFFLNPSVTHPLSWT